MPNRAPISQSALRPIENRKSKIPNLLHQQRLPRTLHLVRDLPMKVRRHSRNPTGKDLPALSNELLQQIRILPVNRLERDIDAPARHRAIRPAEVGAALWSLW